MHNIGIQKDQNNTENPTHKGKYTSNPTNTVKFLECLVTWISQYKYSEHFNMNSVFTLSCHRT